MYHNVVFFSFFYFICFLGNQTEGRISLFFITYVLNFKVSL